MSELIFKGRVLDLYLEPHRLPDGREAEFEIVRHPGGAAILPVDSGGRLLLIRQFRPAGGSMVVEIPAGRLEANEDPLACVRRELAEEVGLEAGEVTSLGVVFSSVGFCDEQIHLFVARQLREVPCCREADEFIEPFWVSLDEALEMIEAGEIPDAKTQLALLRYARQVQG